MNRQHRLTKSTEFKRVRRTGKSYAHPLAVLIVSRNDGRTSRFGFIAGKAVGGAVARNRAKRRLRAALRAMLPTIKPGWDILLIARPALNEADWPTLNATLRRLLERANLLKESNGAHT